MHQSIASCLKEVMLHFYAVLVKPHLECCGFKLFILYLSHISNTIVSKNTFSLSRQPFFSFPPYLCAISVGSKFKKLFLSKGTSVCTIRCRQLCVSSTLFGGKPSLFWEFHHGNEAPAQTNKFPKESDSTDKP